MDGSSDGPSSMGGTVGNKIDGGPSVTGWDCCMGISAYRTDGWLSFDGGLVGGGVGDGGVGISVGNKTSLDGSLVGPGIDDGGVGISVGNKTSSDGILVGRGIVGNKGGGCDGNLVGIGNATGKTGSVVIIADDDGVKVFESSVGPAVPFGSALGGRGCCDG